MAEKKLKVTLVRSKNHRSEAHLRTLEALGLKKIGKTVTRTDNAAVRGMLKQLQYMVKYEEAK
jgi:large subunit ribosomal protein L30